LKELRKYAWRWRPVIKSAYLFCEEILDPIDSRDLLKEDKLLVLYPKRYLIKLPSAKAPEVFWLLPNRKHIGWPILNLAKIHLFSF
jgi:hypothetical protein